jgi:hypothetical protein
VPRRDALPGEPFDERDVRLDAVAQPLESRGVIGERLEAFTDGQESDACEPHVRAAARERARFGDFRFGVERFEPFPEARFVAIDAVHEPREVVGRDAHVPAVARSRLGVVAERFAVSDQESARDD